MDYKGYRIYEEDNRIIVENVRDFNLVHIFECGQCFRWNRRKDGSYTGVVKGRVVNVDYCDGILSITNSSKQDFIDLWFDYFDLGRDYGAIKSRLGKDEIMKEAIEFGSGIRLLRQDIWETLISFIISANNRIPRIMKTVENISREFGDEISHDGKRYYAFPEIDRLSDLSVKSLSTCGGGFRCKYVVETSRMLRDGAVDLKELAGLSTDDARNTLMGLPGVGHKIADCVLLYSGTKYDVFPTDVWVKRVMEALYIERNATFKEIQAFARNYFGELAGFAQQYLFYYARENRIGV